MNVRMILVHEESENIVQNKLFITNGRIQR